MSNAVNIESEVKMLQAQIQAMELALDEAKMTLRLIATPMRRDGTYNRCRKACELLAVNALGRVSDLERDAKMSSIRIKIT